MYLLREIFLILMKYFLIFNTYFLQNICMDRNNADYVYTYNNILLSIKNLKFRRTCSKPYLTMKNIPGMSTISTNHNNICYTCVYTFNICIYIYIHSICFNINNTEYIYMYNTEYIFAYNLYSSLDIYYNTG